MIGRNTNSPSSGVTSSWDWRDGTGADTEVDGAVADNRTDRTGVDWIVEAGTDDDEDGTEDGTDEAN